ncbi:hypothetical protein MUP29_03195 [bacterium]|nr:hypothetical protein [bacterium]
MKGSSGLFVVVLAGLLAGGLASTAWATDTSSCVTCHLDKEMLTRNLSGTTARKSAMQSGQG